MFNVLDIVLNDLMFSCLVMLLMLNAELDIIFDYVVNVVFDDILNIVLDVIFCYVDVNFCNFDI